MLFMGMCQAMQLVNENVVVLVLFLQKNIGFMYLQARLSHTKGKKNVKMQIKKIGKKKPSIKIKLNKPPPEHVYVDEHSFDSGIKSAYMLTHTSSSFKD